MGFRKGIVGLLRLGLLEEIGLALELLGLGGEVSVLVDLVEEVLTRIDVGGILGEEIVGVDILVLSVIDVEEIHVIKRVLDSHLVFLQGELLEEGVALREDGVGVFVSLEEIVHVFSGQVD